MKLIASIALLTISVVSAPLLGAEPSALARSVEQQLREVDIALATEQYKKLKKEILDIQMKLQVEDLSATERAKLDLRMERLDRMGDTARFRALSRAGEIGPTSDGTAPGKQ